MAKTSGAFDLFAIVKAVETDVVCAAHPTEARNPNYQPLFRQKFISYSDSEAEEDLVLQHVGKAQLQKNGTFIISLSSEVPPAKSLILKPAKKRYKSKK